MNLQEEGRLLSPRKKAQAILTWDGNFLHPQKDQSLLETQKGKKGSSSGKGGNLT